jgi:hypothetical protein
VPEPGEDLADLRAVPLRASLGGQEYGDHLVFRRRPQQAHAPVFSGDAILG